MEGNEPRELEDEDATTYSPETVANPRRVRN
jgi:hypothetical protein